MNQSTHASTPASVQRQPTPEEARRFLELFAAEGGYPRRSRDGGVLRRVV